MIRKLNRIFQDYMREKRLKIGKYIWDKKEKTKAETFEEVLSEEIYNNWGVTDSFDISEEYIVNNVLKKYVEYPIESDEYEKMKGNNVDNWINEVKKLSEMKNRKLEDWLHLFKEYNENMNSEEKKEIIKKLGIIYEKNDYIEISNFFFNNGGTIYKIPDVLTDLTEIERKFFMENIVLNKYRITSETIENYRENIDKDKAVDNFIENFFEIGMAKIINQTFGLYDLKEEKKYISQ